MVNASNWKIEIMMMMVVVVVVDIVDNSISWKNPERATENTQMQQNENLKRNGKKSKANKSENRNVGCAAAAPKRI